MCDTVLYDFGKQVKTTPEYSISNNVQQEKERPTFKKGEPSSVWEILTNNDYFS